MADAPGIRLMHQDFRSLFEHPLNAMRQAACQYPSVAIRLIENYGRLATTMRSNNLPAGMIDFLDRLARQLRDHATSVAEYDYDKASIAEAYRQQFDEPE